MDGAIFRGAESVVATSERQVADVSAAIRGALPCIRFRKGVRNCKDKGIFLTGMYEMRSIVRWCVLGVLGLLLSMVVLVLDTVLLVDVFKSRSEWVMPLIIGFILLLIAKSWIKERRWLAALRKYGWPKEIAEMLARDGARWEAGFKLKHWRSPCREESLAWRRNWDKQHEAAMLKPEILIFLVTQCRAEGRLHLAELHEADLEWLLEFERTHRRAPNKVEVAAWRERCKAGEVQEITDALEADGIHEPSAAAAAFMKWAETLEQAGREPTQVDLDYWFARWAEQRGTQSSSQTTQPVPPPSGLPYGSHGMASRNGWRLFGDNKGAPA